MDGDDIHLLLSEEISLADSPRGRWYSEYLGLSYRSAVGAAMMRVGRPLKVLKTDLWNECLGGTRDIVHHLQEETGFPAYALDLEFPICAGGRSRVPGAHIVQADVRALPFRPGSFDAVLDLSTLDHLPEDHVAEAIGEYRRVLRDDGVLLLVFLQRNLAIRLRLFVKKLVGRSEKPGQWYFARADVKARLGGGLTVVKEFVAGSLLIPPQRWTGLLLGSLPAGAVSRFLGLLVPVERSRVARPLLKHLAGLYGIVARRRHDLREGPSGDVPSK